MQKNIAQWTEQEINNYLLATRKLADRQKDKATGDTLLAVGTQLFEMWQTLTDYKNHKVYCGCGKQLRNGIDIEFYNKAGMCLSCDHLLSDRRDYEE